MIADLSSIARLRLFDPTILTFALSISQRFSECPRLLAYPLLFEWVVFVHPLEGTCRFLLAFTEEMASFPPLYLSLNPPFSHSSR